MQIQKKILLTLLLCAAITLPACQQLDVVGNGSVKAFGAIVDVSDIEADEEHYGWSLTAPDKSAKLIWSKDFSKSPVYDVAMQFDAQPFITAGLDIGALPADVVADGFITLGTKYGTETPVYAGEVTPLSSYEQILRLKPDKIGYHDVGDHYMLHLEKGNMLEFAKDMDTNEKDIVFKIDPQPFMDAGLEPDRLDGWIFTKMETMDDQGRTIEADALLKIFDLK